MFNILRLAKTVRAEQIVERKPVVAAKAAKLGALLEKAETVEDALKATGALAGQLPEKTQAFRLAIEKLAPQMMPTADDLHTYFSMNL